MKKNPKKKSIGKIFQLKLSYIVVTNGKSKSVRLDSTAQMVSHNIFQESFSENHCVRKQQYLIQVGLEGNREIARFFPENDFHRTFLPTCKYRCLRQIRSIFLDLLVDPSAFHPHTTKLWKAQC